MLKICNECGKEYETKNSLPKPKPKNHKPVFSINDIVRFQENYFRSHNKSISYTEAVAMLERG